MEGTELDLTGAAAHLEAVGYEVRLGEVARGRRQAGVWLLELVIDRAGRLRLTATASVEAGAIERVLAGGVALRALRETRQVTTVRGHLDAQSDLPTALAGAERLARGE